MIIGFSGTQKGMTEFQKENLKMLLDKFKVTEFVHGDCIGADSQANDIALDLGCNKFTIFPSNIHKKRAWKFNSDKDLNKKWLLSLVDGNLVRWGTILPPLERNALIVQHSEILIACPKEHRHTIQSGTWATIRRGWKKAKLDKTYKVIVIPPINRIDNA